MELDYTSRSEGNAALATGIIGTGLGAMNLLGNIGNFANQNRFNGDCGGRRHDFDINRREFDDAMNYERQLSDKNLVIASLEAEKISDRKDVEVYKQIKSEMNLIEAQIAAINGQLSNQAVQNQANKDSFQLLQERMETHHSILGGAIEREVATRKANDNLIINYVNTTFDPKVVVSNTYEGGTLVPETRHQHTYNPLPACDCNC